MLSAVSLLTEQDGKLLFTSFSHVLSKNTFCVYVWVHRVACTYKRSYWVRPCWCKEQSASSLSLGRAQFSSLHPNDGYLSSWTSVLYVFFIQPQERENIQVWIPVSYELGELIDLISDLTCTNISYWESSLIKLCVCVCVLSWLWVIYIFCAA